MERKMRVSICDDEVAVRQMLARKVQGLCPEAEIAFFASGEELLAGENFFRSHRAYLVNFKYVERYSATEIILERGCALMAKKNYPAFVKNFMRYNRRKGC